MLNMIKLDWLGMKTYHLWLLAPPLVILLFVFLFGSYVGLIVIPMVAFFMWSISTYLFMAEEKGKLENLYLTLPILRKTLVKARFGLFLFMQLSGIVFSVGLALSLSPLLGGWSFMEYLYGPPMGEPSSLLPSFDLIIFYVSFGLLSSAFFLLCSFPFLFKFGYSIGKIPGVYLPVVVMLIIFIFGAGLASTVEPFAFWFSSVLEWAVANTLWFSLVLLAVAAVFFALSYLLSLKAFEKREL